MSSIPRSPMDSSDVRMAQTIPSRHYSLHSMDNVRPSQSYANLHSYYASQRAGQRTPDEDLQLIQMKRRIALQRDVKTLPSEYPSNSTSNTGSASSSLILDTSITGIDPVHSPLPLHETIDDPYSNRRRRFRLGSASFEGLVGINESDLTPRAPQTAGVIGTQQGSRTSPTATFDPFSTEFGQVAREQREHDRRLREPRSRGDSTAAESPSPQSTTFSLFSSEGTQTNTNTTASSPESSPLKPTKPALANSKIAPIGTKRSNGSLNSDSGDTIRATLQVSAPITAPLPSPHITTPANEADKWNVFSGGWGAPFAANEGYHTRSATNDSSSQKTIWGSNPKGLGMTVGSGSVDVWG
jgi:hypothetical protein